MLLAVICALLAAAAALDDGCAMATVKVGVIGAGANTKSRHIPGLQAISGVEVTSVCACPHLPALGGWCSPVPALSGGVAAGNRSPESTNAVADAFGIAKRPSSWSASHTRPLP